MAAVFWDQPETLRLLFRSTEHPQHPWTRVSSARTPKLGLGWVQSPLPQQHLGLCTRFAAYKACPDFSFPFKLCCDLSPYLPSTLPDWSELPVALFPERTRGLCAHSSASAQSRFLLPFMAPA